MKATFVATRNVIAQNVMTQNLMFFQLALLYLIRVAARRLS